MHLKGAVNGFLLAHLAVQAYVIWNNIGPGLHADFVVKFLQTATMAVLWYTAWTRHRKDPGSPQKRLVHYAFLAWMSRLYVKMLSPMLADMISLAVVWLFLSSQWYVLNVPKRLQDRAHVLFATSELLLFLFGLLHTVNPGVVPNKAHTLVFTLSHLIFIGMTFLLFLRAALISRDLSIKYRFAFLILAAGLYTGVFLSDFFWRSLVPGPSGNFPVYIKHLLDALGMLSLFAAFNMGDKLSAYLLSWHRPSHGLAELRLISLVLRLSEAAARERCHILPSMALRVAENAGATEEQKPIIAQAGALLAILHRHELPDMSEQWAPPELYADNDGSCPLLRERSTCPFEERLEELAHVQKVLEAVDNSYGGRQKETCFEAEILRAVLTYLTAGDLKPLVEGRGYDFSPEVVDALLHIIEPVSEVYS